MRFFKKINFLFVTISFILLLANAPAMAQCGFDVLDRDESQFVEDEEFAVAVANTDYFDTWDVDEDGLLTEYEWEAGVKNYFGTLDTDVHGEFADWNMDDDEVLNELEFEYGLFDAADTDDSDEINQDEWDFFDKEEDGFFC